MDAYQTTPTTHLEIAGPQLHGQQVGVGCLGHHHAVLFQVQQREPSDHRHALVVGGLVEAMLDDPVEPAKGRQRRLALHVLLHVLGTPVAEAIGREALRKPHQGLQGGI